MNAEIENELDKVKLKHSDEDVELVLEEVLGETEYEPLIGIIINQFRNQYISKLERENGNI
jgi:ribosomal protein L18E